MMKKGKDGFYNRYVKRVLDFLIALLALILLSPLMLILTVTGAIAMKGNPFFCQKRPGRIDPKTGREKIFTMIKFRTMTNETDADGRLLPDEKRLNKYGEMVRKLSLDEILEVFPVLAGHMSLVGPRPLLVQYLDRYTEEQHHRHDVRPGVTGYAQVHGRNCLSWEDKFDLDLWYVAHVSLREDIKILWQTLRVVLKREGINSGSSATMEEFMGTCQK